MPAKVNLYKFDMKGNQISFFSKVIKATSTEVPYGIETNHKHFYIVMGDPNNALSVVHEINKKNFEVRSFTPTGNTTTYLFGITTNRNDLMFSGKHVSPPLTFATIAKFSKSNNKISQNNFGTAIFYGLSYNGKNYMGAVGQDTAGNPTDRIILFQPGASTGVFTYVQSITITGATLLTGVCSLGKNFAVIDTSHATGFVRICDYSGNVIKSFSLPKPLGTEVYTDLCTDGEFLWIVEYEP